MSGMAESSGPLPAANASNSSSSTSSSTTSSSSTTPGLPSSTPSNLSNVMRNPPPLSSPSPERGGSQHNNHPVPSSASSSSSGLPPTSPSSGPASPFGNLSASQQQQHAISPSTAAASALLMSSPPLRPLNAPVQSQSQQQQHSRSGQSTPNRGYSSASSSVIDSAASADGTDNIAYTSTSRAASRANSVSRAGMSGTTIARPDYSSYKLVVAMVSGGVARMPFWETEMVACKAAPSTMGFPGCPSIPGAGVPRRTCVARVEKDRCRPFLSDPCHAWVDKATIRAALWPFACSPCWTVDCMRCRSLISMPCLSYLPPIHHSPSHLLVFLRHHPPPSSIVFAVGFAFPFLRRSVFLPVARATCQTSCKSTSG